MSGFISPLGDALHHPVSVSARALIAVRLWGGGSEPASDQDMSQWGPYFDYYTRECSFALMDKGKNFCARTHEDVVRITELLVSRPTKEDVRAEMRKSLTGKRTSEEELKMLESSIIVVVRLFAMINIGVLPAEVSGKLALPWHSGSLQNAISDYFTAAKDFTDEDIILKPDFTARSFNRVAGMGILWTDNLLDHLRLVDNDRKVCIFHHITFLKWMEHIKSPLFSEDFLKETLKTLTLVIPSKDRKTKRWLEGEMESSLGRLDRGLLNAGHIKGNHPSRQLKHYQYWRERLGALYEVVEESTPPSKALLKALSDRKRGDGWLNSWVAVVAICLTLFFGLVQSIEGAIQVYKAYRASVG